MSTLYEIDSWYADSTSYWNDQINTVYNYSNKTTLVSQVKTELDLLKTKYDTYKGTLSLNNMNNLLPVLFSYINMKYKSVIIGIDPLPDFILNDDMRLLYIDWYDLPTPQQLFDQSGSVGGVGTITDTTAYTDLTLIIDNGALINYNLVTETTSAMAKEMQKRMSYQALNQSTLQVGFDSSVNEKSLVLNGMHISEILTYFSWTIMGLN